MNYDEVENTWKEKAVFVFLGLFYTNLVFSFILSLINNFIYPF